jgi:hypothetical protein
MSPCPASKRTEDEVLRIQRDNVNAQRVDLMVLGHIVGCLPLFAAMLEQEGNRGEPEDAMKPAGVEPKSRPGPLRAYERSPK